MDNFNIKDSIEELQNKFNEIKEMGYVKGISQNNKGNAGLTGMLVLRLKN
ncbi:unknown [Clostridium sp. CAG:594]|nr:unknown [Clostridium sp. CAG:594]